METIENLDNNTILLCTSIIKCLEKIIINNYEEYDRMRHYGLTSYQKRELYDCFKINLSEYLGEKDDENRVKKISDTLIYSVEGLLYSMLRSSIWLRFTEICTSEDFAAIIFENIYWNLGFDKSHLPHLLSDINETNMETIENEEEWFDFSYF